MSSTTPLRSYLLLMERNSGFISTMRRRPNKNYEEIGEWLLVGIDNATDYCILNDTYPPQFAVSPILASDREIASLEVEEVIALSQLQRETD